MVRRISQFRGFGPSLLLLVVAFLGVAVLPSRADGPHPKRNDQYKHQVERLEEQWRVAQLNDDVEAMDRLLSEDFVGITMNGQVVTKTQQLDRMRNRSLVLSKIELGDVKVKLIGKTAIVTSLAQIEGSNDGTPMIGQFRYTRVYSRQPAGGWKITNFEATRVGPPPSGDRRASREDHPRN
jgi:ketosteroid isomerase-like protein